MDADYLNLSITAALREAPAIEAAVAEAVEALPDNALPLPSPDDVVSLPASREASPVLPLSALPDVQPAVSLPINPRTVLITLQEGSALEVQTSIRRLEHDWPLDSLSRAPRADRKLVDTLLGHDDTTDEFTMWIERLPTQQARRAQTLVRLFGQISAVARNAQLQGRALIQQDVIGLLHRVAASIELDDVKEPYVAAEARRMMRAACSMPRSLDACSPANRRTRLIR